MIQLRLTGFQRVLRPDRGPGSKTNNRSLKAHKDYAYPGKLSSSYILLPGSGSKLEVEHLTKKPITGLSAEKYMG